MKPTASFRLRVGWWFVLLIVGVLAVNAASVWEIAAALRALRDHGERTLELATMTRVRSLESALSLVTADLAFLANSLAATPREPAHRSLRDEVGAAMLLFLRGHPEVSSLAVRGSDGRGLVEAGRPRGVPGYWTPGVDAAPADVGPGELRREFEIARGSTGTAPAHLEAQLDAGALLREGRSEEGLAPVECWLRDSAGGLFAGDDRADPAAEAVFVTDFAVSGWASGPWTLGCRPSPMPEAARLEPVVERHRTTIILNLVVMGLAGGLGLFAYQQARRRQQLEDRARAEARVRELERQLFHAERLGTVGRLAAGMAHEINNPLEGMANYLRLTGESLRQGDASAAGRHLDGVRQGLDRAAGIVCRVLDHANPAGSSHEVVDVCEVVARSIDFVRSRDEFSGVRFEQDLPRDGCRAEASTTMLGQVFLNLVLNACEAQPDGGEVLVRCRRVGGHVETVVADRGPGVPSARRRRIFEPFETTKRSAGLGLSICHSIVQQHGGELTLQDREGGGAVFHVRLKAVEEGADAGT